MAELDRLLAGAAARLEREAPAIAVAEIVAAPVPADLDHGLDIEVEVPLAAPVPLRRRPPTQVRLAVALAAAAVLVVGLVVVTRRDPDTGPAGPTPTVAPTTTVASGPDSSGAAAPGPATSSDAGSVTTASPPAPLARLSGTGIGAVAFGTTTAEAVDRLTALLGAPLDAGPVAPTNTATTVANGCANLTDEVRFFPRGIVAGFRDGRFAAWSAWTAGFDGAVPREPSLPTASGVRLGQTAAEAAGVAGSAYQVAHSLLPEAGLNAVDGIVTDGGPVLVMLDRGLTPDGRILLLTAGVGCAVPDQPDEVPLVVDWSRFATPGSATTTSLADVARRMPAQVPVSLGSARRRDIAVTGGAEPGVDLAYVQVFAPSPSGQVLVVSTSARADARVQPATYTLGPWQVWVGSNGPGFADVTLVDGAGTIELWGQGLTAEQVRAAASALRLRADGPGWDLDGSVPVSEGWDGASEYRSLEWGDLASGPRAELLYGRFSPIVRSPVPSAAVETTDVAGRQVLVYRFATTIVVSWRESPLIAGQLATRDLTIDETLAMVTSLASVSATTWNALPAPVDTGDGCGSFLC